MIKDFYLRLVVVVFFSVGIAVMMASALLIPSYFASSLKIDTANTKLSSQKADPVPAIEQEPLAEIKDINKKLGIIEKSQKNKFIISRQAISEVVASKMSDIKITEITYDDNTQKGKKIVINGTAPSRERLLLFRQKLEENSNFSQVDLPISNFIKGSNIQFSMTLIPL